MNPWAARFDEMDRMYLAQRMLHIPDRVTTDSGVLSTLQYETLKHQMTRMFLPTQRVLDVCQEFVAVARAHCEIHYPSSRDYLSGVYSDNKSPLPAYRRARPLTGHAGVGKSSLVNRFVDVANKTDSVFIEGHGEIALSTIWQSQIEGRVTKSGLLRSYLERDGWDEKCSAGLLLERCRQRAYQAGVSFVFMDETQHQTHSSATASITGALLAQAKLGIPNIYVANFSLLHNLLRNRPKEDRDRILPPPIILMPDPPDSSDWLWTVRAFRDLSATTFRFSARETAEDLHVWTGGIKRLLAELLCLAAKICSEQNRPVRADDLSRAFASAEYAQHRDDTTIIHKQNLTNRCVNKLRKDLWCPFLIPASESAVQMRAAERIRRKALISSVVDDTFTVGEKEELDRLARLAEAEDKSERKTASVSPISKSVTADSLAEGDRWFREEDPG